MDLLNTPASEIAALARATYDPDIRDRLNLLAAAASTNSLAAKVEALGLLADYLILERGIGWL